MPSNPSERRPPRLQIPTTSPFRLIRIPPEPTRVIAASVSINSSPPPRRRVLKTPTDIEGSPTPGCPSAISQSPASIQNWLQQLAARNEGPLVWHAEPFPTKGQARAAAQQWLHNR